MTSPHAFTDGEGRILELSKDGAKLLNITPRGGPGRQLAHFIVHDRDQLLHQIEVASRGHAIVMETTYRPLERAPRAVILQIERVLELPVVELAWSFEVATVSEARLRRGPRWSAR
jgi:hypothetical protein